MKYYTLDSDLDVIKGFPQVDCLNYREPIFQYHLPPDEIGLLQFKLLYRMQFTDIIAQASFGSRGILISERFKKILDSFCIIGYQFFEAIITDFKGEFKQKYYWLNLYNPKSYEWIEFTKSKFYYTEFGFKKGDIEIHSYEDSRIKQKEVVGDMGTIEADKIDLSSKFDNNIDLFDITFNSDIHISERLRNVIIENKLYGLKIKESICI